MCLFHSLGNNWLELLGCSELCHRARWNCLQCQVALWTFYSPLRGSKLKRSFNCSQQQSQGDTKSIFRGLRARAWARFTSSTDEANAKLGNTNIRGKLQPSPFLSNLPFCIRLKIFPLFKKNAKRPKTDEIKNAVDKFDAKKAFWVQRLCIDLDQT